MIGNKFLKRIMAGFSGIAMAFSIIPNFSAFADDTHANYECVLFAQGTDDSIRINSQSISINGDIVTNGTFSTNSEYSGIYGNVFDNQGNSMIDYQSTIEELYFYDDVNYIEYNYDSTNENENIIMPTFVEGSFSNGYNVSITDSALMTIDDITICGNTFNATNSVLYSQLGDIHVETDVFSSSGLIYAPFGTVYIESGNVNINGLVIAQNIEIIGDYSVNINKNDNFVKNLGEGITTPTNVEEDDDLIDSGISYYKDISSEDDIVYAGDGIYCVKNQFLLTAYDSVSFNEVSALILPYNASIVGYIELTNDYQIEFNKDVSVDYIREVLQEIQQSESLIENASLNIVSFGTDEFYTNDAEWNSNWNETYPSGNNWGIEAIKLESALINLGVISNSSSTSNDTDTSKLYNVKIGLIDAGFDEWHEDLGFTATLNNYTTITGLNGETDHGTHVAGIMGAKFNNNLGITGVCIKNRLYGYSTNGNTDGNIGNKRSLFKDKYALTWMIGNNVKVINHSMGNGDVAFFAAQDNSVYPEAHKAINAQKASADEYEKLLSKLIDKGYDFLIVTSAGNSNNDEYYLDSTADYGFVKVSDYNKDPTKYPSADTSQTYGTSHSGASVVLNDTNAKYDDAFQYISSYKVKSHIISVGSLSQSGRISDFSCRGARVDILAPGENIRSTVTTGRGIAGGNYCDKNGTSMAAPHVSGALGLAYSVFPSIKASTLKGILTSKASDYGLIESVVSDSGATINKNYKVLNVDTLTSETLDKLSKLTTSGSTYPSQFNGIAVGFVLDENGAPLPDVNITATLESSDGLFNNNPIPIGSTSEDGSFEIILPAGRYCLEFEKLLYLGTLVYYEAIPEETAYLGEITLFNESWTDSIFQTVYGQVSDAMNGNAIAGATVKFRGGWNNTTGSYESNLLGDKVATTDSTGNYSMALQVGAYTAEISKDGYITSYVNVISSPNAIIHFSTITPILDEDEYRIILTWGDSPRDLDSHLIGSVDGNSYEVYYGSKTFSYNGEIIASLDHDDTTSYGPETITLTWKENSGNCSYYVYDYTNGGNSNSMALTYSSAKVVVYKGNSLIKSYNVPIGYNGTRWNVFTISNGVLTTVNTIS